MQLPRIIDKILVALRLKRFAYIYVRHPGFNSLIYGIRTRLIPSNMFKFISQKESFLCVGFVDWGNIGLYFEFTELPSILIDDEETDPSFSVVFLNEGSWRVRRLEITLDRSQRASHVHLTAVADGSTIYSDDAPLDDCLPDSEPFFIKMS